MARRKTGPRAWVRVSNRTKDRPSKQRRWEVVYEDPRDGFKRRTKGGFPTKGEAESWHSEFLQEARSGSWVDPARGDVTLHKVAQDWLATYAPRSGKSRGRSQHAQIVNGPKSLLRQEFGSIRIGDISHSMVGLWVTKMQSMGRSPSTIRHNFYTLRLVMRYAVAEGIIPRDPTASIKPPAPRDMAAEEADRPPLTMQQALLLAAAVPEPWGMYVRLAAATGMRPGELAGLQLRDVSPDRGTVQIRRVVVLHGQPVIEDEPKTSKSRRTIELDDDTAGLLDAYIARHTARALRWFTEHPEHANPGDNLPLFVGVGKFQRGQRQRKTGTDVDWLDFSRPLRHGWFFSRHWAAACRAAGVPAGVRFYDLRHAHASWHVARLGQPGALTITEISERLGHASTAMTLNRYAHSPRDRQEQKRAALAAMWDMPENVTPLHRKQA